LVAAVLTGLPLLFWNILEFTKPLNKWTDVENMWIEDFFWIVVFFIIIKI
jgi:hypothetical protein